MYSTFLTKHSDFQELILHSLLELEINHRHKKVLANVLAILREEQIDKVYPALKGLQEVDTMGGLLVALKEVVPRVGESAMIDGLQLIAVVADDRRVRELVVKRGNQ